MSYTCPDAFSDLTEALVPDDFEPEDEESVSEYTDAALAEIGRLRKVEREGRAVIAALDGNSGDLLVEAIAGLRAALTKEAA
jgi:hypothetical protein